LLEFSFNFIRGNVLSLGKLENILLSVDDLESTIRKEHANVSSVNPAFSINSLASLFRLAEISFEIVITLVANFTTGHRSTSSRVNILTGIVHFGYINKFDIKTAVGTTDMSRGRISLPSDSSWSSALGLTIAFQDLAAESDL
jgi:hypothetical protein